MPMLVDTWIKIFNHSDSHKKKKIAVNHLARSKDGLEFLFENLDQICVLGLVDEFWDCLDTDLLNFPGLTKILVRNLSSSENEVRHLAISLLPYIQDVADIGLAQKIAGLIACSDSVILPDLSRYIFPDLGTRFVRHPSNSEFGVQTTSIKQGSFSKNW